jgi:hypothetical protein
MVLLDLAEHVHSDKRVSFEHIGTMVSVWRTAQGASVRAAANRLCFQRRARRPMKLRTKKAIFVAPSGSKPSGDGMKYLKM